jgi:Exopolysaccharide biosynthesis protein related to N-acetylglucosamine-1-phosphodiester alpha-N-acetylglucosaminidase
MHTDKKHFHWGILYGTLLVLFTAYVLLDTFVIPRSYASVQSSATEGNQSSGSQSETSSAAISSSDTSYDNGSISITLTTSRYCDTTVYVADITLADVSALKTALADDTYGKNITATTSSTAESNNAVLAINGDFYGAQNRGYVIRNGVLYRDTAMSSDQEDLVIGSDGSFSIITEGETSAQELLDGGAWQVLSFGPGLLENGEITVGANAEVSKSMTSNPRTDIGEISPLHYVMVVADGRTSQSAGLSLYELAEYMQGLGVTTAYNLDGGGSSTLYFNGTVVNRPTTDGKTISERKVSDIVYIGT